MAFLRGPTNFVNDMLYSNCQRPFYIYLTTAIPCLVEAVIALRLWDFGDMVRATGEAAAVGAGGPRRGKPHTRSRKSPQARGSGRERAYKQGLKHLLAITQPLETIGFALLLYGVVDRFYASWMMYLDDADACLNPDFYGPLIRRVTDGFCFPNGGGNTCQLPELICDNGNWGSNNIIATLPVGRYVAVWACTITGPGGDPSYELEIRCSGVIGSGIFSSGAVQCKQGEDTDLICTADIFIAAPTGGQLQWIVKGPAVPIGLSIPKADIYIQRRAQAFD